jgi:hypothetical protein
MNQTLNPFVYHQGIAFAPLLLIGLLVTSVGWLAIGSIYTRYTGLSRWRSALLWLLSFVAAIIVLVIQLNNGMQEDREIVRLIVFVILFSMFSAPFLVRLYRKWIGGRLTEGEKLSGIDGVRAWLVAGNVICAILIPICAWQAFGYSPIGILVLTFGALLAYPLLNMASDSAQQVAAVPAEDFSNEREKVLQLLEAGKINPVESAELLNALAHSAPATAPKPVAEINPQRKLVLTGAAVLLVGFFLPWFNINPGAMLNDAASQLQQNLSQMMPGNAMPQMNIPLQTGTVQVHAGDLAHGLGWWILALGMIAAVLPFFATTLESSMQKKIILAALGIGVFLLLYLLSDTFKYVSFGFLLALAGYALEVVGTLKERPLAR